MLTKRQKEVACLIAQGLSDDEIAKKLDISIRTIERYANLACKNIGIKGRVQLVRWIYEQGWIKIGAKETIAYKSLLAALALSPSSKAVMNVTKRHRLVIERHWAPININYSVYLVDMIKRDVAYATGSITGMSGLQEWAERVGASINVNIDLDRKRWLTLEEAMQAEGKRQ